MNNLNRITQELKILSAEIAANHGSLYGRGGTFMKKLTEISVCTSHIKESFYKLSMKQKFDITNFLPNDHDLRKEISVITSEQNGGQSQTLAQPAVQPSQPGQPVLSAPPATMTLTPLNPGDIPVTVPIQSNTSPSQIEVIRNSNNQLVLSYQ